MSTLWNETHGEAIGGVVSVLFTSDRRMFFEHDDGTIRAGCGWERNEVLELMLSWRDSRTAGPRDDHAVES